MMMIIILIILIILSILININITISEVFRIPLFSDSETANKDIVGYMSCYTPRKNNAL